MSSEQDIPEISLTKVQKRGRGRGRPPPVDTPSEPPETHQPVQQPSASPASDPISPVDTGMINCVIQNAQPDVAEDPAPLLNSDLNTSTSSEHEPEEATVVVCFGSGGQGGGKARKSRRPPPVATTGSPNRSPTAPAPAFDACPDVDVTSQAPLPAKEIAGDGAAAFSPNGHRSRRPPPVSTARVSPERSPEAAAAGPGACVGGAAVSSPMQPAKPPTPEGVQLCLPARIKKV